MRALCVSIHDVAPETWPSCRRLIDTVRSVAPVPLTLLVVPRFHGCALPSPESAFVAALRDHVRDGDELALHGLFHLDDAPAGNGLWDWGRRRIYTAGEGEFAALPEAAARQRIALGLEWFAQCGWQPEGFVAPAWLLGTASWLALHDSPLRYATTLRHFHDLRGGGAVRSTALTYSVRSAWRRTASKLFAATRVGRLRDPVVRLALHPADAAHPDVLRQCRRLLESLLRQRTAMTKAQFVRQWHAG